MSTHSPVPARIRLVIANWPDDAPRGAVTTFCREHEISRKTFYKIWLHARRDGSNTALEPRSRRPHHSPERLSDRMKAEALSVRAGMEQEGLDHGPISVHDRMRQLKLATPSTASLSRIFREAGVARADPSKKPRAAWQHFVYPQPNSCWQLDGTNYVLVGGSKCVILQLTDDHSRKALATKVAPGETSDAAVEVFRLGVQRHGVPQRLLTDNGSALNPARRGIVSALFLHATELGVEAITGKPGKPTTQGKNERFHQTLFRWLAHKPQARTIEELQSLVDEFDVIFNTHRPHQALPGRMTPDEAWNATPKAIPPQPDPDYVAAVQAAWNKAHPQRTEDTAMRVYKVDQNGVIAVRDIKFTLGRAYANSSVVALPHDHGVIIATPDGNLIIDQPWPPAGVKRVGNGKPRGRQTKMSPMS